MFLNNYGSVDYELKNIIKRVNENDLEENEMLSIIEGLINTIDRVNKAENRKRDPDHRVFDEILEGLKKV